MCNARYAKCLIATIMSAFALAVTMGIAPAEDPKTRNGDRPTAVDLEDSFMKAQWEPLLSRAKPDTNPPHDALNQQATDIVKWLLQSRAGDSQHSLEPICIQIVLSGDFTVYGETRISDLKVIKNKHGKDVAILMWCLVPQRGTAVRIKVLGTFISSTAAGGSDRQVMHACREFALEGKDWKPVKPISYEDTGGK